MCHKTGNELLQRILRRHVEQECEQAFDLARRDFKLDVHHQHRTTGFMLTFEHTLHQAEFDGRQ